MSQEVLSALDAIHSQIRKRLMQNAEYRALLSIERTIAEVAEIANLSSDRRAEPARRDSRDNRDVRDHRDSRDSSMSDAYSSMMADSAPMPAVTSVLESIAAKAVSSVAARNSVATSVSTNRASAGGR